MKKVFYSVRFHRSAKEKPEENCFISNHKERSNRTSDGGEVILDEVLIISSFAKNSSNLGRVDEPGLWDVECIKSRRADVWLVKKARKATDRVKVELNGDYVNIVVNGKLAVYTDEAGVAHKLGYNGWGITEYAILGMFYKLVPQLDLPPDFSVIDFEKEFLRQVDVCRTMAPVRELGSKLQNGGKKKRPRIKKPI